VAPPFRAVFSCRKQQSDTGQKPGATKNSQGRCGSYSNCARLHRIAPMKRRVFTILAVLSLAICVMTCVLWTRSYYGHPYAYKCTTHWRWSIIVHRGKVFAMWAAVVSPHAYDDIVRPLSWGEDTLMTSPDVYVAPWGRDWTWGQSNFQWAIFQYGSGGLGGGFERWISFPAWLVGCLALVVPLSRTWRLRSDLIIRRKGRCVQCGYDLRATPDRCPECGTKSKAV